MNGRLDNLSEIFDREYDKLKKSMDPERNSYEKLIHRRSTGRHYTTDELVHEIKKKKAFYKQYNGGVTFSGGQVLSRDMDYREELLERLFRRGFRNNIDTCGYVAFDRIKRVLPYVNTFLYDMKIMDAGLHKKHTGADRMKPAGFHWRAADTYR